MNFRYVQIILVFLGITIAFFARQNVGIALVAMTDKNGTDYPTFNWTFKEQQYILSSYNLGYVISQIPATFLLNYFGSKPILLVSIAINGILQLATPVSTMYGSWQAFCAIRFFQGLLISVKWPCVMANITKWFPTYERQFVLVFVISGVFAGTIISLGAGGLIAASPLGWPGIFYICGGLGVAWSITWWLFGASSPGESRIITEKEKAYIFSKQGVSDIPGRTPWKAIFTSKAFLSFLVIVVFQEFGMCITMNEIPLYFNKVLKMDLEYNAILACVPMIAWWIMSYIFMAAVYFVTKTGKFSLAVIRKSLNTLSVLTSSIVFILLGFITEEHKILAVLLLTINGGIYGSVDLAYWANLMDLSPNFCGLLIGIGCFAIYVVELITPLIVGAIVQEEETDRERWQIVFAINAVILPIGCLLYNIYGRMELQDWNSSGTKRKVTSDDEGRSTFKKIPE